MAVPILSGGDLQKAFDLRCILHSFDLKTFCYDMVELISLKIVEGK